MRDFTKISHFLFFIIRYKKVGQIISRILCFPRGEVLIIYLDGLLPDHSNRLPSDIERATLSCRFTWRCTL